MYGRMALFNVKQPSGSSTLRLLNSGISEASKHHACCQNSFSSPETVVDAPCFCLALKDACFLKPCTNKMLQWKFHCLDAEYFQNPTNPEEFFPQYPCTGLLVNLTREKSLHTRSSCESICEFLLRDVKRQKSFSFFFFFFNHVVFVLASEKNLRLLESPCISFLWIYNLWHLACVHTKKILGWVLCIPGKTTAGFKYKQKCQFKCIHGLLYFFIFSLAHALVRYKPRAPRVRPGSLWPTDLSCAAHKDRLQD